MDAAKEPDHLDMLLDSETGDYQDGFDESGSDFGVISDDGSSLQVPSFRPLRITSSAIQDIRHALDEHREFMPDFVRTFHGLMVSAMRDESQRKFLHAAVLARGPAQVVDRLMSFILTTFVTCSSVSSAEKVTLFQASQLITWIAMNEALNWHISIPLIVKFYGQGCPKNGQQHPQLQREISAAGLAQLLFSGIKQAEAEVKKNAGGLENLLCEQMEAVKSRGSCLENRAYHCMAITQLLRTLGVLPPGTFAELLSCVASVVVDAKLAKLADGEAADAKQGSRCQAMELIAVILGHDAGDAGNLEEEWRLMQEQEADARALFEGSILDMLDDEAEGSTERGMAALLAYVHRYAPAVTEPDHPLLHHLAVGTTSIQTLCGLLGCDPRALAPAGQQQVHVPGSRTITFDCMKVLQRLVAAGQEAGTEQLLRSSGLGRLLQLCRAPTALDAPHGALEQQQKQLMVSICTSAITHWPRGPAAQLEDAALAPALNDLTNLLLGILAASHDGGVVCQTLQNLLSLLDTWLLGPDELDTDTGEGGRDGLGVGRCCRALAVVLQRGKAEEAFPGHRRAVLQAASSLLHKLFSSGSMLHHSACDHGLLGAMMSRDLLLGFPELLQGLLLLARASPDLHSRLQQVELYQALLTWVVSMEDAQLVTTEPPAPAWTAMQLLCALLTGPQSESAVSLAATAYTQPWACPEEEEAAGADEEAAELEGEKEWDFIDALIFLLQGDGRWITLSTKSFTSSFATSQVRAAAAFLLEKLLPEVFSCWCTTSRSRNVRLMELLAAAIQTLCSQALQGAPAAVDQWTMLLSLINCVRGVVASRQVRDRRELQCLSAVVYEVMNVVLMLNSWPQEREVPARSPGGTAAPRSREVPVSVWTAGFAPQEARALQAVMEGCLTILQVVVSAVPSSKAKPDDCLLLALFEHRKASSLMGELLKLTCMELLPQASCVPPEINLSLLGKLAAQVHLGLMQHFDPWPAKDVASRLRQSFAPEQWRQGFWNLPLHAQHCGPGPEVGCSLLLLDHERRQVACGNQPSELRSSCALATLQCLLYLPPPPPPANGPGPHPKGNGTPAPAAAPGSPPSAAPAPAKSGCTPTPSFDLQLAAQLVEGSFGVPQALLCLVKCEKCPFGPREAAMKLLVELTHHLRTKIFMLDPEGKLKWLIGANLFEELMFMFPKEGSLDSSDLQVLQLLGCRMLRCLVKAEDAEHKLLNRQAQCSMHSHGLDVALAALCSGGGQAAAPTAWKRTAPHSSLSGADRRAVVAEAARRTLMGCGFHVMIPALVQPQVVPGSKQQGGGMDAVLANVANSIFRRGTWPKH